MDTIRSSKRDVVVFEPTGRLDAFTIPELRRRLEAVGGGREPRIVLDLSGVNFVDSTALATMVQGLKRCRQGGGELVLCGLQDPVRIIFELTRLDQAFRIVGSREAAVRALRG